MGRLPFRTGSLVLVAVTALGWQFESGRFGVGERPVLADPMPRDVTPPPGSTVAPLTILDEGEEPVRLTFSAPPELGRVGLDTSCPPEVGADGATCGLHVDLGGMFATSRAPGRFQVWCDTGDLSFAPATVLERDVRIVGTASNDFRTVVVLELAGSAPGEPVSFVTLRRDPSASATGAGCPTLQELGTGLPIDHEVADPYAATPGGVPLLLSVGGVSVRPSSVGVELVRLTPEVTAGASESAAVAAGGGD